MPRPGRRGDKQHKFSTVSSLVSLYAQRLTDLRCRSRELLSGCIALCLKPNQQQQQEERAGDARQSFERASPRGGRLLLILPACLPAYPPADLAGMHGGRMTARATTRGGRGVTCTQEDEAAEEETERTGGLIWTQAPVASTVGANSSDVSNPSPHSSMFIHPKT